MAAGTTLFHKLQQSVNQIDPWIAANKPTPSKSEEVFKAFMARYGSTITGSDAFVAKTTHIIEKASRLAAGITVLQRLLDTGHDLSIKEEKKGNFFSSSSSSLKFNFTGPKLLYTCLNDQGERVFHRHPRTAVFIHESLHAWHSFCDPTKEEKRSNNRGHLPEMDSAEEELTITGDLHHDTAVYADPCCENTALRELGYPLRINHKGTDQVNPDLHELVENRIFPKIRELSELGQIHNGKNHVSHLTPLELAMYAHLLEQNPEVLQEWIETMRMLIQGGGQSEYALNLAILQNSKEIIELLLQAGTNLTDEILEDSIRQGDDRFKKMWQILEQKEWVISLKNIPNISITGLFGAKVIKQMQQKFTVEDKFKERKTLPIHTLQKLFYDHDFKSTATFNQWRLNHSPLPPPPIPPHLKYNKAFTALLDGSYIRSSQYSSRYPMCFRSKADCEQLGLPCSQSKRSFSQTDIENFIKHIRPEFIRGFANELSQVMMNKLDIVNPCAQSFLTNSIKTHITTALASPTTWTKGKLLEIIPCYYLVDIPIISEEEHGFLQHVELPLKNKNGEPISSAHYSFLIVENGMAAQIAKYLYFHGQVFINGYEIDVRFRDINRI